MDITAFNAASADGATQLLRQCADIPEWADRLVEQRPFASRSELIQAAAATSRTWTATEIDQALADHPRIGERPQPTSPSAHHSRQEQAQVSASTAEVVAQIAAGNVAYEERFGRVFLIRAAGRSAQEINEELTRRLRNTPEIEAQETADALREIALLRLEGALQ